MARRTTVKDQETDLQISELTKSVTSESSADIDATLKALGLEIAKHKIREELEVHVLNWMLQILRSDAPENVQIRNEIVDELKAVLAASVLSDCLKGAISDSQKLITQSQSVEPL